MKNKLTTALCICSLIFACNKSDVTGPNDTMNDITLVAKSGNAINMDGVWQASCIPLENLFISESFTFSNESLIINIRFFDNENCLEPAVGSDIITITFSPGDTYEVEQQGAMVLANKISGTESSSANNTTGDFKQAFYIDDSQIPYRLYHGVFEDDGGAVTNDGYPLELHPIAIVKKQ